MKRETINWVFVLGQTGDSQLTRRATQSAAEPVQGPLLGLRAQVVMEKAQET